MRAAAEHEATEPTTATDDGDNSVTRSPQGTQSRLMDRLGRIARHPARRRRAAQGAIAITGATMAYTTPVAQAVRVAHGQVIGSPPPVTSPTPVGVATPTGT